MTATSNPHFPGQARSYNLDRPFELNGENVRLNAQALVPFAIEANALRTHEIGAAGTVLMDLGPGNGEYLRLMAQTFELDNVVAIEANASFLELCRRRLPSAKFYHGNVVVPDLLKNVLEEIRPSVVTARYLFQHLTADHCDGVLATIRNVAPGTRLIVTDTDDTFMMVDPPLLAISRLNRRLVEWQADRGGDRYIGRRLKTLFAKHGFSDIKATPVLISSHEVGLRAWWSAYGPIYLRIGNDYNAAADDPDYLSACQWVEDNADNPSVWISKIIHIVSGIT